MKKASKVYLNGCVENTSVYSIKLKKMLKNNTSGVRGVTFDKASQKWKAQIVFKGRNYYLGRYINKEAASIKYDITYDEITELLEILIAEYNNTPNSGIDNLSPLECMRKKNI